MNFFEQEQLEEALRQRQETRTTLDFMRQYTMSITSKKSPILRGSERGR